MGSGFLLAALLVSAQVGDVRPRTLEAAGIQTRASADDPAEAQDRAVLERTLYGKLTAEEMDERQAEEMIAAARRIFDRRKQQLEDVRRLVAEGAAPRLSITARVEALDAARREVDLAESRASLVRELAESVRLETAEDADEPGGPLPLVEKYAGNGVLLTAHVGLISKAFEIEFARPLPVTARGDTRLHRLLGFDHRGRVDVGIDPDAPDGVWLRNFLQAMRIPYYAFRAAVPGKATGRHIHIGPASERFQRGD